MGDRKNPNMVHVPSLIVGAVVGAVVGVVAALVVEGVTRFCAYREARSNKYKNNDAPPPYDSLGFHPNLTCPYCNQYLGTEDPIFPCRHKYHQRCHMKATYKNCTFCQTDGERNSTEASSSKAKEAEKLNNDSTRFSTDTEERSTDANSSKAKDTENLNKDCCYCKTPLNSSETRKANCGHVSHKECYEKISHLMKCQDCPMEEQ